MPDPRRALVIARAASLPRPCHVRSCTRVGSFTVLAADRKRELRTCATHAPGAVQVEAAEPPEPSIQEMVKPRCERCGVRHWRGCQARPTGRGVGGNTVPWKRRLYNRERGLKRCGSCRALVWAHQEHACQPTERPRAVAALGQLS